MKKIKDFDTFEGAKPKAAPLAKGKTVDGVIVVNADEDFEPNQLFYCWTEYPAHKELKDGRLLYSYQFYTDDAKNKYMVVGNSFKEAEPHLKELIKKADWDSAYDVDQFTHGVYGMRFEHWKKQIA